MDEQDTGTDRFGCVEATQHGVLEERPAKTGALMRSVNRESSEENRRHRPRSRLAFERALGRSFGRDLRSRQRVVTGDRLAVRERRHEDTR